MAIIRKFLDLSTAHVPWEARAELPMFCAVAHATDYGWLMWVPDDPVESNEAMEKVVHEELLKVQLYARERDCDYVLFDSDGDTNADLPVFEEGE